MGISMRPKGKAMDYEHGYTRSHVRAGAGNGKKHKT